MNFLIIKAKETKAATDLIYFKYDFGYEFGILNPYRGKTNTTQWNSLDSKYNSQSTAVAMSMPVLNNRLSTSTTNDSTCDRHFSPQLMGTCSIERGDFST